MATPTVKTSPPPAEHKLELAQVLADLVADGLVPKDAADQLVANRRAARGDAHPLIVIADQKWKDPRSPRKLLHLEALTQWLAEKIELPYFHIDPFKIDFAAVTKTMSSAYAERYRILPVAINTREVTIAVCEPHLREWEEQVRRALRLEVKRVLANPLDIQSYLVEFYNLARSIKGATAKDKGAITDIANFEQLVQLGRSGKLDANDQHIVHICDWLFNYAFQERASDIHLEPRREVSNVRFRIDGALHQVYQIPTPVMTAMVSRIKILGRMDVVEKRRPQDGRLKTVTPDGDEVELRLSTMPTAFGEKLVMRIFNPENLVKNYKELGFTEDDERKWSQMVANPHGIILVTGPTGSGKTTTLYSTLKQLAEPDVNVCTVEDPIEMVEPAFNQMPVAKSTHPHAPGPGHHHGRRDPRSRDRRDGDPGGADGPPGALDAPHQRRAFGDHAAARPRGAVLPAAVHDPGRHGAAAAAHAVPELQGAARPRRLLVGASGVALEGREAQRLDLRRQGLPRLPHDGLHGTGRHLRDDGDDARAAARDHAGDRYRRPAGHGVQRGHAPAADRRRDEGGGRRHHHGRGAADRAAAHWRPQAATSLTTPSATLPPLLGEGGEERMRGVVRAFEQETGGAAVPQTVFSPA
jgi:energy-coupling factor transporter ATP-binding protein EcfA2